MQNMIIFSPHTVCSLNAKHAGLHNSRSNTHQNSGCWWKSLSLRASGLWSQVVALVLARCVFYCFLIIARLLSGSLYWSRQAGRQAACLTAKCLWGRYFLCFSSSSSVGVKWGWYLLACVGDSLHVECMSEKPGFLDNSGWNTSALSFVFCLFKSNAGSRNGSVRVTAEGTFKYGAKHSLSAHLFVMLAPK